MKPRNWKMQIALVTLAIFASAARADESNGSVSTGQSDTLGGYVNSGFIWTFNNNSP